MCGANPTAVKSYQQMARAAIADLLDKELAEQLAQKVRDSQTQLDEGDWEYADDLADNAYHEAVDAVAQQDSVDKLIAEVEDALDQPIAEVQPTVHTEVEDEHEHARKAHRVRA